MLDAAAAVWGRLYLFPCRDTVPLGVWSTGLDMFARDAPAGMVWRCRLSRACWGRGCCLWRTSSRCRDGECLRFGGRGCKSRFVVGSRCWRGLFWSRTGRSGLGLVMCSADRLHSLYFVELEYSFLDTDLPSSVKVSQMSLPRKEDSSENNLCSSATRHLVPTTLNPKKEWRELRRKALKKRRPRSESWRGSALNLPRYSVEPEPRFVCAAKINRALCVCCVPSKQAVRRNLVRDRNSGRLWH